MSEQLTKALELFDSNQFDEAGLLFLVLARDTSLTIEQRELCYRKIFKCSEYDKGLKNREELQLEFAEFLYEVHHYSEAEKLLSQIKVHSENQERVSKISWRVGFELGSIDIVLTHLRSEIKLKAMRSAAESLEGLKNEIESKKISFELENLIDVLVDMISGNSEHVLSYIESQFKNKNSKNATHNLKIVTDAFMYLSVKMQEDLSKRLVGKCVALIGYFSRKELSIKELKSSTSLMFEAITLGLSDFLLEAFVCEYTLKSRRKEFFLLCEEVFSSNRKGLYRSKYQQQMSAQVQHYSTMRMIDQSEIDFGTDLFREENKSEYDVSAKKDRLCREINLLKKANKIKEASELIKELEKIDEDHPFVKELNEQSIGQNASRLLRKRNGIDEIIRKISNEILLYSKPQEILTGEATGWSSLFLKNIEYMSVEEFKTNQKDLIVSSMALDIPDVAMKILEDSRGDLKDEGLEYYYFKISILIKQGLEHQALDLCNETIEKKVMLNHELITFLYMKAELLRSLGKRMEAIKIYKKVYDLDPGYRLAKYRMSEIDQF